MNINDVDLKGLFERALICRNAQNFDPLDHGNLFSILNMENKEVTAHSAFLYFIFKPFKKKDGKIDDLNLRLLIKMLLRASNKTKEEIDEVDKYSFVNIEREYVCETGRLDFFIQTSNGCFVIELKVWSGEGFDQINRYIKFLRNRGLYDDNVFFLTPAKRKSITGDSINITMKYEKDSPNICSVLNEIKSIRKDHQNYITIINQYIDLINKITGGKCMDELNCIKKKNELLAIKVLEENRIQILKRIIKGIFDNIYAEIGSEISIPNCPKAIKVEYTYGAKSIDDYYTSSRKVYPSLVYLIEDNAQLNLDIGPKSNDAQMYFFIEASDWLYCGFSPRIKVAEGELSQINMPKDIVQKCRAMLKDTTFSCDKDWIAYDHMYKDGKYIDFNVNNIDNDNNYLLSFIDDNLQIVNNNIKTLVNAIKDDYKKMCHKFYKTK